jgi:hypothetical protein
MRFSIRLTNKTDGDLGYYVFASRVNIDWMPTGQGPGIATKGSVTLSANEIYGYSGRGDEVQVWTWRIDPAPDARPIAWDDMEQVEFIP